MQVYRFSANDGDYTEWVVANDLESATKFVKDATDIYEEYADGSPNPVEVKELTDLELDALRVYTDDSMTKFVFGREAVNNRREKDVPYLLCSSLD